MALGSHILMGLAFLSTAYSKQWGPANIPAIHSFSRSLDEPMSVNDTCTVGSYAFDIDNTTLGVYCSTDDVSDFAYDWTFIDISLCIGNNDGALAPSPEGNFSDSCQDCDVTWSHVYLAPVTTTFTTTPHAWATSTATIVSTPRWDDLYLGCGGCTNRDYQLVPATIDLNQVMINYNGTIGCHTYKGTTMHAKPDQTMTVASTTIDSGIYATTNPVAAR